MTVLAQPSRDIPREQTTARTVYPFPPRRRFVFTEPEAIYENYRTPLDETLDDIDALLTWPAEWDGYQVAPSLDAVTWARSWIKSLYDEVEDKSAGSQEWIEPLVVADAHRNVVFEWVEAHKRLVIYVSPNSVQYLKAWGPDIWSDMDEGNAETPDERWALWRWLTTD